MKKWDDFSGMHLQWFGDEPVEPAKTEPAKTESIKDEPAKVDVNEEFLDNLSNDYPQVFEKWIKEGPLAKKVLAPWKDSHVSQGLNTFKENTLPELQKELENKLRDELTPTKSPELQRIIALEKENKEAKEQARQAEIKARGSGYIGQTSFDLGGIMSPDEFVKGTEEETIAFIDKVKDLAKYYEEKGKKSFIKDNNYKPPAGESQAVPYGGDKRKWQEAMKVGKAPKSGPEFEKTRDALNKHIYGK